MRLSYQERLLLDLVILIFIVSIVMVLFNIKTLCSSNYSYMITKSLQVNIFINTIEQLHELLHSFDISYFLFVVLLWAAIVLMLIGPANSSNVNDNTSGVVTLLEIARSIPELHRKNVCFVLFDLEEAGLIGSAGCWPPCRWSPCWCWCG